MAVQGRWGRAAATGAAATVLWGLQAAVLGGETPGWAAQCPPTASGMRSDFNGDGHADAVVMGSGGMRVLYGTTSGLALTPTGGSPDDQLFRLRGTVVAGDFNGDGCADAALGNPGSSDGGAVTILYGSRTAGLTAAGSHRITRTSPGVPPAERANDRFGQAVAAGDFDDDGYTDLAVGAPSPDGPGGGAVWVLHGGPAGIGSGQSGRYLDQDLPGVPGTAEMLDKFGAALAAGDFDRDGVTDLAVGVPGANIAAGAVVVFPHAAAADAALYSQNSPAVPGTAENYDHFGAALASGDITGDGGDDLAVGAPEENHASGAVNVLYSSSTGLNRAGSPPAQVFTQSTPGIAGIASSTDYFGNSVAIGRLDSGGLADLAIGVPFDFIGTSRAVGGSVTVLYGRTNGLTTAGSQRLHQDVPGIAGVPESDPESGGDEFGSALSALPIRGAGIDSLLIGVPHEAVRGVYAAGLLHVLPHSAGGPDPRASQTFTSAAPQMQSPALHPFGYFGGSLGR